MLILEAPKKRIISGWGYHLSVKHSAVFACPAFPGWNKAIALNKLSALAVKIICFYIWHTAAVREMTAEI